MLVSEHIQPYELAVVFGAGASMPALPSQRQLIPDLWKALTPPYPLELPIHRLLPAGAYLRRTFPGLPARPVSFEDVAGPLEISEAEEYWFHFAGPDRRTKRLITNQSVLDALDTWLVLALNPLTVPRRPSEDGFAEHFAAGAASRVHYARLLHLLAQSGQLEQTVFLSLNYDVLLDRSLLAATKYEIDYVAEAFVDKPALRPRLRVMKLHGSLNWRCCDSCHVLVDLGYEVVWPLSRCGECGERRARPLLIRPTVVKDFRHRVWQDVWRPAGRALAGARRWLIVGYSLPLADVWMLRLLAPSMRSGGQGRRRVSIVEPDPAVVERFRLLFPHADHAAPTFDDYLASCHAAGNLV